jgi:phosphatidylethanolamine-binding protein (PEBP) family uncharacterized protein
MKRKNAPLATAFALALAAGTFACAPAPDNGGNAGTGGSSSSGSGGSTGTGGTPKGTGGTVAGTGGTVAGTGGTTAGTGGTVAGTGGTTAGTGGTVAGTGGTAAGTGGTTGTPDAGASDVPAAGGKMMITVDSDPATSTPTRLCFKPEAGSGGGDKSPKIDWTAPPAGTMSLVLMMEDLSNTPTPHRVLCNLKPTETGSPADVKAMLPEGAQAGTGHSKPMDRWYGPGAGVRNYEITIFALATPMLAPGCGPGGAKAKAARDYLKMNKMNKAVVLDYDSKVLWGSAGGACK